MERLTQKRPWLKNTDFEIAIHAGWENLVADLLDAIGELMVKCPDASLSILQIKEKFGGLRFYYQPHKAPEELRGALADCCEKAENLSWVTCETCGAPGRLREAQDRYWFWVRCDQHAPKGSRVVPQCE